MPILFVEERALQASLLRFRGGGGAYPLLVALCGLRRSIGGMERVGGAAWMREGLEGASQERGKFGRLCRGSGRVAPSGYTGAKE